ncbi:MAG: hypothetical protein R2727_01670 [Bacteroidales bacterium]
MSGPEEAIYYLINNTEKGGYSSEELFQSLARMISDQQKSADEILDYFNNAEKNRLWILWLVIGATFIAVVIVFIRKRKKDKEDSRG